MKRVMYFKELKEISKKLRDKVVGFLKLSTDYDLDYIMNMKNIYILYDNNKIYSIINYLGILNKDSLFFFNNEKGIHTFDILFFNEYEDSCELLKLLNKKYKHILIWKNDNIYEQCLPKNFKLQKQYKENISILLEEYFCFDSCYISNVEEDYFLNMYLDYQYYNNVNINEIEFSLVENLYSILCENYNMKLPIYFDSTSALKLCEPYDKDGKHIIGLYKDRLVFDLCIKEFYDKNFLYYICTRKDIYNKGVATKGIEYLSTLNFYDKIYSTDLTEEGKQAHINDKMKKYLKEKYIINEKSV